MTLHLDRHGPLVTRFPQRPTAPERGRWRRRRGAQGRFAHVHMSQPREASPERRSQGVEDEFICIAPESRSGSMAGWSTCATKLSASSRVVKNWCRRQRGSVPLRSRCRRRRRGRPADERFPPLCAQASSVDMPTGMRRSPGEPKTRLGILSAPRGRSHASCQARRRRVQPHCQTAPQL